MPLCACTAVLSLLRYVRGSNLVYPRGVVGTFSPEKRQVTADVKRLNAMAVGWFPLLMNKLQDNSGVTCVAEIAAAVSHNPGVHKHRLI